MDAWSFGCVLWEMLVGFPVAASPHLPDVVAGIRAVIGDPQVAAELYCPGTTKRKLKKTIFGKT